jgi:hypothetical protein
VTRFRPLAAAAIAAAAAAAGVATVCMAACSNGECHETLTCDLGPADTSAADVGDVTSEGAAADVARETATDATTDVIGDAGSDVPVEVGSPCEEAGLVCTAAIPPGFQGPVVLALESNDGGVAPAPPACGGAYAVDAFLGYAAPLFAPAACTCACGAVDGGCTGPVVETFTDNTCVNKCNQVIAGACTVDACGQSSQSAKVTMPSQPSGGSCPESVQKSVPPWNAALDWATAGRACAAGSPPDAGCPSSEVCAAPPPASFGAGLCVWQAGDVPCPAAYPMKEVLYASATDTRDCTDACTCGSPAGVTCSATVTASPNANCGGGTLLTGGGQCNFYGTIGTPYVSAVVMASGGSCTSGGSATPSGSVAPIGPSTICCTTH